jgi:NAD(P)-dependent dehydrogenase (short-subunit alcohol dehydrogenase family)
MMSACQAAIAEATKTFGKIDILVCCTSQGKLYVDLLSVANPNLFLIAIVGTVEELAASQRTLNLVRDQFESNYFGPVNIIRAALPHMRKQKAGHIQVLSGISMRILVRQKQDGLTDR